jgi:hypothetical protein
MKTVINYERWAVQNGLPDLMEPGAHCPTGFLPASVRRDIARQTLRRLEHHRVISERLRKQYADEVIAGRIRPPTAIEDRIRRACGHPDNQSTQAARRMLVKRGYNFASFFKARDLAVFGVGG